MSRVRLDPKFITDSNGVKTAVVLDMKQYRKVLALIEEAEDIEYVKGLKDEPVTGYREYRKRRLSSEA